MIRSLQLRTAGPSRLGLRPFPSLLDTTPATTRAASLSAIHRGLRRSERAQYGEPRSSSTRSPSSSTGRSRGRRDDIASLTQKAMEGAGSKRQQAKLASKLRRKQEEQDGTGKQTRRKRFVDPDSDYGKSSVVWQLNHGKLQDLKSKIDDPVRPRSFRDKRRDFRSDGRQNDRRDSGNGRRDAGSVRDAIAGRSPLSETRSRGASSRARSDASPRMGSRSSGFGDEPAPRTRGRSIYFGDESSSRDNTARFQSRFESSPRTRTQNNDSEDAGVTNAAPRPRNGNMMPITIKYTTAASQFLYGRSVVRSVLDQGRRKLYNLYISGGDNRLETKEISIIKQLARERRVPITIVPTEDQRLMDKMSMGRPHNGFVLETSPLPQLPITSLGKLEETSSKSGFHVELGHQTKEEAAINGDNTFVRRASKLTEKPMVLLLNEILDPGNLGAMLRTASYLGVDAVGITSRNSSTLTPVVLKSAAGAVEEVTIFTVDSPATFLEESKKAGWKSYAAVPPPNRKLAEMHGGKFVSTSDIEKESPLSKDPCILVLGNEGFGLPKQVKVAADYELSVPRFMHKSCVDSLNVSVAAGLLCHAFIKEPAGREVESKDEDEDVPVHPEAEPLPKVGDYMF